MEEKEQKAEEKEEGTEEEIEDERTKMKMSIRGRK